MGDFQVLDILCEVAMYRRTGSLSLRARNRENKKATTYTFSALSESALIAPVLLLAFFGLDADPFLAGCAANRGLIIPVRFTSAGSGVMKGD